MREVDSSVQAFFLSTKVGESFQVRNLNVLYEVLTHTRRRTLLMLDRTEKERTLV
jgi:hypothetical protein